MTSACWFIVAALLEISGCFAFWLWLREDKTLWWLLPGVLALIGFAWSLTHVETAFAGRSYAAYGGVYITASLLWGILVEHQDLAIADIIGALLCLLGAGIIFLSPNWV